MGSDYEYNIPRISSRYPDLSLLCSEAAIDMDGYTPGQPFDGKGVMHLSKLLDDSTKGQDPEIRYSDLFMPLAYIIYGRDEENLKGKHVDELVLQINLVTKELKDFENLSDKKQKNLVDFCINLNREILIKRSLNRSRLMLI